LEKFEPNLKLLIQACRDNNEAGRKKIYDLYYNYGMSVSIRYSGAFEEAEEILNDSFLKAFLKIDQYDYNLEFKFWLRKIIINTAIDHKRKKKGINLELQEDILLSQHNYNDGFEKLLYEDLLKAIHELTPGYRLVFNLYAIDGYKHHEIAERLNISVGSSKSNYAKARMKLQTILKNEINIKLQQNG